MDYKVCLWVFVFVLVVNKDYLLEFMVALVVHKKSFEEA